MNVMNGPADAAMAECEAALRDLAGGRQAWAETPVAARIALLRQVREATFAVAAGWAEEAARRKLIPAGSPLAGEEWLSGPYAVLSACDGLIATFAGIDGKHYLDALPRRRLAGGQLALKVMPRTIWDRLLFSGISAEVWMQPGIGEADLPRHAAVAYDRPPGERQGRVALVLGAGNIAAIAPLDCFQKLFCENQVVLLKMNPVNDYLTDWLRAALRPLIDAGALRIVRGDGRVGAWLCEHPLVDEIHITGARATHDAIVWGAGAEGVANRAAGRRRNARPITSELGAVCPTIVVPGPWSKADIRFQAEQIATQKLHNSGFNCVACQVLILPEGWAGNAPLLAELARVMVRAGRRPAYYPGAAARLAGFAAQAGPVQALDRGPDAPACLLADFDRGDAGWQAETEIFAPALSVKYLPATEPASYLDAAVAFANDRLYGTLGANLLIHPKTRRQIGARFETALQRLHYGCIAINAWTGLGFLLAAVPWGGFAGATLQDVQSGIGTVHNCLLLEATERAVVEAPWAPFPRSLLSGRPTLLPRPPWFVTNRRQDRTARLLTCFLYRPRWWKLPAIVWSALRG